MGKYVGEDRWLEHVDYIVGDTQRIATRAIQNEQYAPFVGREDTPNERL